MNAALGTIVVLVVISVVSCCLWCRSRKKVLASPLNEYDHFQRTLFSSDYCPIMENSYETPMPPSPPNYVGF